MSNLDITSANSESILTVEGLFPAGIVLQGYGTDAGVALDNLDLVETRMGLDGFMAAGVTPNIFAINIALEPNSPSVTPLGQIWTAMTTAKRIYECTLVITVPSVGRVFTFIRGVMKSGVPFSNINRILATMTYGFNFENMKVTEI
jgi:hypothetical protein